MKRAQAISRWVLLLLGCSFWSASSFADVIRAAVTSNFAPLLEQLAAQFEQDSGHSVAISSGASGRLFSQISNGAPFDVYFSADSERPTQLVAEQKAVAGTVFTYALGKLVLWSSTLPLAENAEAVLQGGQFAHLAIANPKLAPYGVAAQQVLQQLHVWDALQGKLVLGENVAQALQFVESGNADLGFIALAQWQLLPQSQRGSPWQVPAGMHAPITQDAVILHDTAATRAFMAFMQSAAARAAIGQAGYTLP